MSLFAFGTAGTGLFGATNNNGQQGAAPATPAGSTLFGTRPSTFGQTTSTPSSAGTLFGAGASTAAPAAGGGLFGATPAPAAGATGATGGGMFGSTTPSASAASSAGTSLFGATGTTGAAPSLFGSMATPAAGAAGTTPSLFGAPAPSAGTTSLFGNAPGAGNTPSLFGTTPAAPAMATPSLFGTPAAAPTASGSTSGLFGATSIAQPSLFGSTAASNTGSLFGQPVATSQPSLFGTQPTTAGSGASLFGQPQQPAAQPQAGGLFGTASAPAGTGLFNNAVGARTQTQTIGMGSNEQAALMKQFEDVIAAWEPNSSTCAFHHFFYNLVPPEQVAYYQRPANWTNTALWERALRENPDPTCMVPVLATGFDDLKRRVQAQDKTKADHQANLKELSTRLDGLSQKHVLSNAVRAQRAQVVQMQLALRVLRLVQHLHLLLPSVRSSAIRPEEEQLRVTLERVADELSKPAVRGKLNELWAGVAQVGAMRERERRMMGGATPSYTVVDEEGLQQIIRVLREQQQGIAHIAETLEQDKRAVDIMLTGGTASTLPTSSSYGVSRSSLAASQMLRT
ncbi:nucleoporin complex subunit 54-domain-containing protein [Auriculariales sp. MPI-PUGE-AT-0066]|nr:nucleoporin complex subunit 54-domain-containing protein [Auriculariales sp. MPI-PUGE-AT-0066]